MEPLTTSYAPIVLRTDFSDQTRWESITELITAIGTGEEEGFQANVILLDDPQYAGATTDRVLALIGAGYTGRIVILVDAVAITTPDNPVLVVELARSDRGQTFRCLPAQIQAVENNLSLANLDWRDFADRVSADGVFRGF